MKRVFSWLNNRRALVIIVLVWALFFWKFFLKGLLPIPADITVGMYFPWLDYQWGFPTGVPVKNPLVSDIPSLLYPWRMAVIEAFKSGRWPLWNPAYFLGMPLLANFQSAAFSLANVFFLFLRETLAWSWGVVSQSLLSLLIMYLFLKRKKLSLFPSLLGAVVFSFSGFAVVWHQYNVHGWTMLFLPLILLFTDIYFTDGRKTVLFLLSLSVAFQVFSGYFPLVIYSWIIIGLWLVFEKRLFVRKFWSWLVFVCLGAGIASIQLVPGIELVVNSIRKVDPMVEASQAGYLPLKHLITLVVPNFFGNPATGNYWGKSFYDNFSFWVGIIPLWLAIFTFFSKKKAKEVFFWLGIAALGFIFSFSNPVGGFLEKIFFLKGGVSARGLFLVDFSLAVLAAFGLEKLIENNSWRQKAVFGATFAVVLFVVGLTALIIPSARPEHQLVALRNSVISWVTLFGFLLVLLITSLVKKTNQLMPFLVFVLVVFGLWYPAQKYWSFVPESIIFPSTPVIDFLKKQDKPFRFEPGRVIPQNMWMPYGLETASGYDTLLPKRQGELLSIVKTNNLDKRISRVHLFDIYGSSAFPLLNVRYILAKKTTKDGLFSPEGKPPSLFDDVRFQLVFEDKTVQVYQDYWYQPRIWPASQAILVENDREIVHQLVGKDFDSRSAVINRRDLPFDLSEISDKAEVKYFAYQPEEEVVVVSASGPVFLVESAGNYPGWRAYLDSEEIKIVPVNYALRGYFIPQGEHNLRIVFDPLSFRVGKAISLGSVLLLLVTGLVMRRRLTPSWQKRREK